MSGGNFNLHYRSSFNSSGIYTFRQSTWALTSCSLNAVPWLTCGISLRSGLSWLSYPAVWSSGAAE